MLIILNMNLNDYFEIRGNSQQALADALGITQSRVSQLAKSKKPINPERCVAIETATGGLVTRKDLRPDDWQTIWPELADADRSPGRRKGDGISGRRKLTGASK